MMRYWIIVLGLLVFFPLTALGDGIKPVLNQIKYPITAEAWVSTQTAEVVASVNATLNEEQLAKARNDILEKLNTIAKADWHITQFMRNPNDSGLEQLQILAQTRLPEAALSSLREQAKKASKPGETFKIESITFEPTLAETEAMRKQLRDNIYQKVQAELQILNKIYSPQHYVVHTIQFMDNSSPPRILSRGNVMMAAVADNAQPAAAPMTVANKLNMTANVVLVSVNQ